MNINVTEEAKCQYMHTRVEKKKKKKKKKKITEETLQLHTRQQKKIEREKNEKILQRRRREANSSFEEKGKNKKTKKPWCVGSARLLLAARTPCSLKTTPKKQKNTKKTKKPWRVGSVRLLLAVLAQKTPKKNQKKTLVRRKREAIISCTYAVLAR